MTDGNKPNPIVRLFPSLTDVAFLLPIAFLFVRMQGTKVLLGDCDTGWHLRTGEWILAHGRVPHHDIFSFTKPGQPWFAWEWLWDVMFGWLNLHWGLAAVVLGSVLVIALTFLLLFRLIQRKCSNPLIAMAVIIAAAGASSIHWLARPHMFTILFVVIFCSILERARDGNIRLLALLPFLTVLWTNIHGGFFVGIILTGAYAGGELAAWLLTSDTGERHRALARSKPYLLTALGCVAASFINPYFYRLHLFIFQFFKNGWAFEHISEYQSLNFHSPAGLYLEPLLLIGGVAAFRSLYRKEYVYALLIVMWAHFALIAGRNIPIFVVIVAPVVAATVEDGLSMLSASPLAGWLRRGLSTFQEIGEELGSMERIGRVHLVSLAAFALLVAIFYAPAPPPRFRAQFDPKKYPAQVVEMLRETPSAQRIFANDQWGGYLIYSLYPDRRVFVDGRCDFYGPKFGDSWLKIVNGSYDWQKQLDRYDIDTVLLPVGASLASTLKQTRGWRVTFDDGIAIVFQRAAEFRRDSLVSKASGVKRDRGITKPETRDLSVTQIQSRRKRT